MTTHVYKSPAQAIDHLLIRLQAKNLLSPELKDLLGDAADLDTYPFFHACGEPTSYGEDMFKLAGLSISTPIDTNTRQIEAWIVIDNATIESEQSKPETPTKPLRQFDSSRQTLHHELKSLMDDFEKDIAKAIQTSVNQPIDQLEQFIAQQKEPYLRESLNYNRDQAPLAKNYTASEVLTLLETIEERIQQLRFNMPD